MLYQKPSTFTVSIDFSQASSQYQLIITQESCPNFANQNLGVSGNEFLACGDSVDLAGAQTQPNQTFVVTCANIGGSYNVTFLNSESHFSSGLSCTGGNSTIAIPMNISPDLPGDCILDTFGSGSSGNGCE